jgi:hypothetical protein
MLAFNRRDLIAVLDAAAVADQPLKARAIRKPGSARK